MDKIPEITKLEIVEFKKFGIEFFTIIDIRGKQSFLSAHLENSLHLETEEKIINFLKSTYCAKPIILVCFSSIKAKEMATKLIKVLSLNSNKALYPHLNLYYLNTGIMELDNLGFPSIISASDNQLPPPVQQKLA